MTGAPACADTPPVSHETVPGMEDLNVMRRESLNNVASPSLRAVYPAVEPLEPRALMSAAPGEVGVPDVVGQFNSLKRHADALGFHHRADTPDASNSDHYQGLARFPWYGPSVAPLFYASQLDEAADRGGGWLHVVQLDSRNRTGERLRSSRTPGGSGETETTPPPVTDTVLKTVHFDGANVVIDGAALPAYKHPGGVTIYDNILFVPIDQPVAGGPVGQILLFDLGSQGESRDNPVPIQALPLEHGVDNVGVTRLANGRFLIYANGDGGNFTRFYQTNGKDLRDNAVAISPLYTWSAGADLENFPGSFPGGTVAHQSATFMRQANGTPQPGAPLFMIATRNTLGSPFLVGTDKADLFEVKFTGGEGAVPAVGQQYAPGAGIKFAYRGSLDMVANTARLSPQQGRLGNFAAGATAYVSPTGELILYSVPHDNDGPAGVTGAGTVNMAEWRHRDVNRPGSTQRGLFADTGGPYNVLEGDTVTLSGQALGVRDRPWVEFYDDTNFADTDFGQRSLIVDFDDRNAFGPQLNDFDRLDTFEDKPSSVRWRAPVGVNIVLFQDKNQAGRRVTLLGTGQTEEISNLESVSVGSLTRFVNVHGKTGTLDFGDDVSSMRFEGDPGPPGVPGSATLRWDLDGDGVFGESGFGATRGDEVGQSPVFQTFGIDGPGTATVVLQAETAQGTVTSAGTVFLRNANPSIGVLSQPTPVNDAGMSTVGLVLQDRSNQDALTLEVNWGDPSSPDNIQVFPFGPPTGFGHFVNLTHRYVGSNPNGFPITFSLTDDDGGSNTVNLTAPPNTTTPMVTGGALSVRSGQKVAFTFNKPIAASSVNVLDILIHNRTSGRTDYLPQSVSLSADGRTVEWNFGNSLDDGNYRFTLPFGVVSDTGGNALSNSLVLQGPTDYVLAGDINRDRSVNGADFAILAANFGKSGRDYSQGDLTGDGVVNGQDFAVLAARFGRSLPAVQAGPSFTARRDPSPAPLRILMRAAGTRRTSHELSRVDRR
jgi:hypothetical protein